MSEPRTIRFTVNGDAVDVIAPDNEPLLWTLRNRLGLKAARFGCGEGSCGACVVLVDSKVEQSCTLKLWAVEGKSIETAEALVEANPPHSLVEAFAKERAGQCGYCLSGILMRAKGLLDETPQPSRDEIIEALDEGLCRCGAHPRIMRAIERASTQ